MIFSDIRARVLKRLDEDPTAPVSYTAADANNAINEGLQFFGLLTLCVERTVAFPVVAGTGEYQMLSTYADWLVPLRIAQAGAKVRPARLGDLAARDLAWRAASGAVSRYSHQGGNLLVLYKCPTGGTISITYAACPAILAGDNDVPEIPVEYHPLLVLYGIYRLRFDTGGQDFAAGLPLFKEYLAGAAKMAGFIRTRSLGLRYDKLPFELEQYDVSRLVSIRKDLLPARKEAPSWQST
jgi:hypothetical protein